jgi:hypothetical protein
VKDRVQLNRIRRNTSLSMVDIEEQYSRDRYRSIHLIPGCPTRLAEDVDQIALSRDQSAPPRVIPVRKLG